MAKTTTNKREKAPAIPTISKEQVEEHLIEYANADAELEKITAEMNLKLNEIKKQYTDRVTALTAVKDEKFTTIQLYATQNKDNLFDEKRSVDYLHGTIGYRWGNYKVVTVKGVTFKAAVKLMEKVKMLHGYLVQKVDLNKDLIIANREDKKLMEKLKAVGIEVDQEENFFIELKKEEVPS